MPVDTPRLTSTPEETPLRDTRDGFKSAGGLLAFRGWLCRPSRHCCFSAFGFLFRIGNLLCEIHHPVCAVCWYPAPAESLFGFGELAPRPWARRAVPASAARVGGIGSGGFGVGGVGSDYFATGRRAFGR